MHSADICCSVYATVFENSTPQDVLNRIHEVTNFGPFARKREEEFTLDRDLRERMDANEMLSSGKIKTLRTSHLGTQGDGNHFAYVGVLESTGKTVLVTHHGSRGVGALLYKEGKKIAEKFRQSNYKKLPKHYAVIPSKSYEGRVYWDALQLVREWTRENHRVLHDAALEGLGDTLIDRFWNEHNFVFSEDVDGDQLFWHAKGATPVHNDFLPDTDGVQIIPMNMGHPILFVKSSRNDNNRGFAPHGAGRNLSRTAHVKTLGDRDFQDVFTEETKGIDARFYFGHIDVSELPSAYKTPEVDQADMDHFGLADVVDRVLPYGSIMAGDWKKDVDWKKFKKGT